MDKIKNGNSPATFEVQAGFKNPSDLVTTLRKIREQEFNLSRDLVTIPRPESGRSVPSDAKFAAAIQHQLQILRTKREAVLTQVQKDITALKKQQEEILMWGDTTSDDRRRLAEIQNSIAELSRVS